MNEIISTEAVNTLVSSGAFGYLGKKVLGATLENIGKDIANLYEKGRDKIVEKASKKIKNLDDGQQVNLRIARDVFYNGSFSDDEICAEYFGGILASSRSEDGKNDTSIFYLDIIKSLSSFELRLHYIIYQTLNKMLTNNYYGSNNINVGLESDVTSKVIYFNIVEIIEIIKLNDISALLHILVSKKLVNSFETNIYTLKSDPTKIIYYLKLTPTPIGIQLFAIANNKNFREFPNDGWLGFEGIELPNHYTTNIALWDNISK
ncbi:MAG: hypothetical protein EKK57_07050 [Proteobacteria bacterium]|nr:MAG: hypothetical protein EKK57_07050 [Pseudomonadota bacterium]